MFKLYVQRQLDKLKKLKDNTVFDKEADYYLNLSQRDLNRFESEISNVFTAVERCYENGRWKEVIALVWVIDSFLSSKGDWHGRRKWLEMAVKASEKDRDPSTVTIFKDKLGTLTMHQGNLEEAERLFEDTLEINRRLENASKISSSSHSLGRVAEAKGDYEKAKRLYEDSLKISEKLGDKSSMAVTYHELGVAVYRMGDYEEARKLYESALKMEREVKDERTTACTLHALALLLHSENYKEKNYLEAERLYKESLKIKQKLNDIEEIARTLYRLAELYKVLEKYEEALHLCQESIEIFEKLGHRYLRQAQNLLRDIKQAGNL